MARRSGHGCSNPEQWAPCGKSGCCQLPLPEAAQAPQLPQSQGQTGTSTALVGREQLLTRRQRPLAGSPLRAQRVCCQHTTPLQKPKPPSQKRSRTSSLGTAVADAPRAHPQAEPGGWSRGRHPRPTPDHEKTRAHHFLRTDGASWQGESEHSPQFGEAEHSPTCH